MLLLTVGKEGSARKFGVFFELMAALLWYVTLQSLQSVIGANAANTELCINGMISTASLSQYFPYLSTISTPPNAHTSPPEVSVTNCRWSQGTVLELGPAIAALQILGGTTWGAVTIRTFPSGPFSLYIRQGFTTSGRVRFVGHLPKGSSVWITGGLFSSPPDLVSEVEDFYKYDYLFPLSSGQILSTPARNNAWCLVDFSDFSISYTSFLFARNQMKLVVPDTLWQSIGEGSNSSSSLNVTNAPSMEGPWGGNVTQQKELLMMLASHLSLCGVSMPPADDSSVVTINVNMVTIIVETTSTAARTTGSSFPLSPSSPNFDGNMNESAAKWSSVSQTAAESDKALVGFVLNSTAFASSTLLFTANTMSIKKEAKLTPLSSVISSSSFSAAAMGLSTVQTSSAIIRTIGVYVCPSSLLSPPLSAADLKQRRQNEGRSGGYDSSTMAHRLRRRSVSDWSQISDTVARRDFGKSTLTISSNSFTEVREPWRVEGHDGFDVYIELNSAVAATTSLFPRFSVGDFYSYRVLIANNSLTITGKPAASASFRSFSSSSTAAASTSTALPTTPPLPSFYRCSLVFAIYKMAPRSSVRVSGNVLVTGGAGYATAIHFQQAAPAALSSNLNSNSSSTSSIILPQEGHTDGSNSSNDVTGNGANYTTGDSGGTRSSNSKVETSTSQTVNVTSTRSTSNDAAHYSRARSLRVADASLNYRYTPLASCTSDALFVNTTPVATKTSVMRTTVTNTTDFPFVGNVSNFSSTFQQTPSATGLAYINAALCFEEPIIIPNTTTSNSLQPSLSSSVFLVENNTFSMMLALPLEQPPTSSALLNYSDTEDYGEGFFSHMDFFIVTFARKLQCLDNTTTSTTTTSTNTTITTTTTTVNIIANDNTLAHASTTSADMFTTAASVLDLTAENSTITLCEKEVESDISSSKSASQSHSTTINDTNYSSSLGWSALNSTDGNSAAETVTNTTTTDESANNTNTNTNANTTMPPQSIVISQSIVTERIITISTHVLKEAIAGVRVAAMEGPTDAGRLPIAVCGNRVFNGLLLNTDALIASNTLTMVRSDPLDQPLFADSGGNAAKCALAFGRSESEGNGAGLGVDAGSPANDPCCPSPTIVSSASMTSTVTVVVVETRVVTEQSELMIALPTVVAPVSDCAQYVEQARVLESNTAIWPIPGTTAVIVSSSPRPLPSLFSLNMWAFSSFGLPLLLVLLWNIAVLF